MLVFHQLVGYLAKKESKSNRIQFPNCSTEFIFETQSHKNYARAL